jgi:hypothetical protein
MAYDSYIATDLWIARQKDYNIFLLRSKSYIFQCNLARYSGFHGLCYLCLTHLLLGYLQFRSTTVITAW